MRQSLSLAFRSLSFGSFFAVSSRTHSGRVHAQPVLAAPASGAARESEVVSPRPDFLVILLRALSAAAV
jgi:hypothetical protein